MEGTTGRNWFWKDYQPQQRGGGRGGSPHTHHLRRKIVRLRNSGKKVDEFRTKQKVFLTSGRKCQDHSLDAVREKGGDIIGDLRGLACGSEYNG